LINYYDKARKLLGYIWGPGESNQVGPATLLQDYMSTEKELSADEMIPKWKALIPGSPKSDTVGYGKILVNILSKDVINKKTYFDAIKTVEKLDYVKSIVRTFATDIMNKGFNEKESKFFTVRFTSDYLDKYSDECNEFLHNLKIYEYLHDMLPYALQRGERIVKLDFKNAEIAELPDQEYRYTMYDRGNYDCCFFAGPDKEKFFKPTIYVPIRFSTYSYLTDYVGSDESQLIVRIGDPLIPASTIERFKSLKILESLIPMGELINIDRKLYFYYRVPPGLSVKDAFAQARDYEIMLEQMLSFEIPDTVEQLLANIAKVKVIPMFGDKETQNQELPKPDRIDPDSLKNIKRSILAAVGNPPASCLGLEDSEKPSPSYLQLLKRMRLGLAECVRWMVYCYLQYKGISVNYENVIIDVPKIPGSDELEVIDYLQMFSDHLNSINSLIETASRTISDTAGNGSVDTQALVNYLNDKMKQVTKTDIFKVPAPKSGKGDSSGNISY